MKLLLFLLLLNPILGYSKVNSIFLKKDLLLQDYESWGITYSLVFSFPFKSSFSENLTLSQAEMRYNSCIVFFRSYNQVLKAGKYIVTKDQKNSLIDFFGSITSDDYWERLVFSEKDKDSFIDIKCHKDAWKSFIFQIFNPITVKKIKSNSKVSELIEFN